MKGIEIMPVRSNQQHRQDLVFKALSPAFLPSAVFRGQDKLGSVIVPRSEFVQYQILLCPCHR